MDAAEIAEVSDLLHDAWVADGTRPLNDHLWLDLREGGRRGFAGVLARQDHHDHLLGYCQVSRGNESWSLDVVVHPHHRYDFSDIAPHLVASALDIVAGEGGGHVHWWIFEPNQTHHRLADQAGFAPGRRLVQMRRELPLEPALSSLSHDFEVRPFVDGHDEEAWLRVNNAAFASHPEQGGWTPDVLASRKQEPWFDPNGFLLHFEGDDLAGFCWTKVHDEPSMRIGEIYVIAVDPRYSGRGLGTKLAVAGLNHLASVGVDAAMLFVDESNQPAITMYQSLGFTVHHVEHAFIRDVAAAPS